MKLLQLLCDDAVPDDEKTAALRDVSITAEHLAEGAQYLLDRAVPLDFGADALDVCGTGGDKGKTFNVSTAAALVLAAGGANVIKHGNKAATSHSGSSDVLSALGIAVCTNAEEAKNHYTKNNLCFLSAPAFHPALKNLAAVRKSLGRPSILNLLGPLCNPAHLKKQIIGVFDEKFLTPMAEAAKILGKTDVMVVHGDDGLDEFSIVSQTQIRRVNRENVSRETFSPNTLGIEISDPGVIRGGTPAQNALIICGILAGNSGPAADIVCLNAAAGFVVAGIEKDFKNGFLRARETVESGMALKKLQDMRA